jgi:hypothetical protein
MASVRLALLACLGITAVAATAHAETPPPYLVLSRPHATILHQPYPAAVKVEAQPYPYGYFGAHRTPQWQRQFGYYRRYTQWSQK